MLSFSELERGSRIMFEGQPYELIEASLMFKGRGSSVLQAKIKNLINGETISKTFHGSDSFEEAEITKVKIKFLYAHKEKLVFCFETNPSQRFELSSEIIGKSSQFLKPNMILDGIQLDEKIINISLPIKVQLKATEAPVGLKGDRSQSGTKSVTLETGAIINAPLFIKEGDIIEVNTETSEYVRRVE